jgi:glycosyltransferase involved in cell wall biosynthesis
VDDAPVNVLLAAYLTMQGVPIVARNKDLPLLKTVLGAGGYVAPQNDDAAEWRKVLSEAMSDAGRSASASARRFLKAHYSTSGAAQSLAELYLGVSGPWPAKKKEKRKN